MSETIMSCYLLRQEDSNTFDSIITVLLKNNQIINLYANGTRKILSKNSRNLIYGDLLEIEFFKSRSTNSLSKLKKIKSIDNTKPINYWNDGLYVLNQFIIEHNKYFNFNLYESYITNMSNLDDESGLIYSLFKIITWSGALINLDCCSVCHSKIIKTISINKMGYLCSSCSNKYNEYIHSTSFNKMFIDLKYDNLENINEFKNKKEIINFLKSYIDKNVGFKIYNYLEVK